MKILFVLSKKGNAHSEDRWWVNTFSNLRSIVNDVPSKKRKIADENIVCSFEKGNAHSEDRWWGNSYGNLRAYWRVTIYKGVELKLSFAQ